jgi:antitoxin component YwqK of YwqJK toxin-antitoxin module
MRLFLLVLFWLLVACSSDRAKEKKAKGKANDTVTVSDGISKVYYEGGGLRAEIPMKRSRRNGLAKEYYKNGKVFQEINYVEGKKDGEARQYYEHGTFGPGHSLPGQ